MQKPKMLIITGPQGSGNHLFSKIFSKHPDVYGWKMKSFWEGHHQEPFSDYWMNPKLLETFVWNHKFYFTSISCPFFKNKKSQVPNYKEFISEAQQYCNVQVAIIGRDKNILELQQNRVRKTHTTTYAISEFKSLQEHNPVFISQELYQLYGNMYLQSLSKLLNFPIADQEITEDANSKYIHPVTDHWVDYEVYKAVSES